MFVMERAPASDKSRLASRLAWIAAAAWLAAVAGGFAFLWRYKSTPAPGGALAPERWPAASAVARAPDRATLLLFAHPRFVDRSSNIWIDINTLEPQLDQFHAPAVHQFA